MQHKKPCHCDQDVIKALKHISDSHGNCRNMRTLNSWVKDAMAYIEELEGVVGMYKVITDVQAKVIKRNRGLGSEGNCESK